MPSLALAIRLAAVVVVALPAAAAPAAGADSLPAGRIVYVSNESGNQDIYSINTDGSDKRRLTTNASDEFDPAWSPDGSRIAFVRNDGGNRDIWLMNPDGSGQTQLTFSPASDRYPAWSPDGSQLAFRSNRAPSRSFDIWRMGADGANPTRLTSDPALWDNSLETTPAWSPDGQRVAFVSDRNGNLEIYTVDVATGSAHRFTQNPATDQFPAWSPDGTKIAFVSNRDGNEEIYTMRAGDGTGEKNLTRNPATDRYPAWSPDGTKIVFRSTRDHGFSLYLMNADGSKVTRLTTALGREIEPGFEGFGLSFPGVQAGAPATPPPLPAAGPDNAGGTPAPALTLTVRAAKRQRVVRRGGVVVYARCSRSCPVTLAGRIQVAGSKRTFKLGGLSRRLGAGHEARLKLRLRGKSLKRVTGLLAHGRRLRAKVVVTAAGAQPGSAVVKVACRR
jgi:Tol biopolymer transport system component